MASEPPLVVDVDGTLVRGDLFVEGLAALLAKSPHKVLAIPFWLARGCPALKRRVAEAAPLPVEQLVLNPVVLAEVEDAKAAGREVWLASGSDRLAVERLVPRVGAAGCLASDGTKNLVGERKAAALVARFGERGFDYVGDERRDLAIWRRARRAIGVDLRGRLRRALLAANDDVRLLPPQPGDDLHLAQRLRCLRPHQWVKNALVFAPAILAHETSVALYATLLAVFMSLSAVASGAYVLNDLLDLAHDRRHPTKRGRPLAAGSARPLPMLGVALLLIAGGLAGALALSLVTGLCILFYLRTTLAYSLGLKRRIFGDVITLTALYAVRVLAGAVAASVTASAWLLAFCLFAFLALAVVKRQSELRGLPRERDPVSGRAYRGEDLTAMTSLGSAAGFAAVVVLALYVQSPEVVPLYGSPQILWLVCPLLAYWFGRMTLLAHRGAVDDDPVVFALRDRPTWLVAAVALVAFAAAI